MRPPCEVVALYVLPAFRSLVTKTLIEKHDFSQVAAAKELGTTQATISQYLYSKRGDKVIRQLEKVHSVQSTAKEIARNIAAGKFSPTDAMQVFCRLCVALRDNNVICVIHKRLIPLPRDCTLCHGTMANGGHKLEYDIDLTMTSKPKIVLELI